MSQTRVTADREEKLKYAITLIETTCADEKSPMQIVYTALTVMEFGQITPKELLSYLEAGK